MILHFITDILNSKDKILGRIDSSSRINFDSDNPKLYNFSHAYVIPFFLSLLQNTLFKNLGTTLANSKD